MSKSVCFLFDFDLSTMLTIYHLSPQLSDMDATGAPKQSYYMGEDPYGDLSHPPSHAVRTASPPPTHKVGSSLLFNGSNGSHPPPPQSLGQYATHQPLPQPSQHTLGRYSKSTNRTATTAPVTPASTSTVQYHSLQQQPLSQSLHHNGNRPNPHQQRHYQDYRSTQTLPRKLDHHHPSKQQQQPPPHHRQPAIHATNNSRPLHMHHHPVAFVQPSVGSAPVPLHNTGPAKPARTPHRSAAAVNRSKSFNVHGLNGSRRPDNAAPIFMEKQQQQQQTPTVVSASVASVASAGQRYRPATAAQRYRSTPHLHSGHQQHSSTIGGDGLQLKSPSIVNLISRSQRDLTRIVEARTAAAAAAAGADSEDFAPEHRVQLPQQHQHQHPTVYRQLHQHQMHTTTGRMSPVPFVNRDTVGIVRGGGGGGGNSSGASTMTDDYYSGESSRGNRKGGGPRVLRATSAAPQLGGAGKQAVHQTYSNRY